MKKRILIVGGVAGGASAATRARRLSEDTEIVMFERGEHVSFANCGLPYHIGGVIEDRERLLIATPEFMRKRYNIDVRTGSEVLSIDRQAKELTVRDLADGREYSERYDKLILSPGASPIVPPITGTGAKGVFTLRSVTDMDVINDWLAVEKPERAVVIGGGYIGLEMTEALVERGVAVTIVELAGQVFGPVDAEMANIVHEELEKHGVSLRLNTSVTGIVEENDGLKLQLSDGSSIACGVAIMAVGVKPETTLAAEAGLAIGERGGISVNELMETSDADIYAVGDAVEVVDYSGGFKTLLPLAGPANRQGCIAADNAIGRMSKYGGSQGTAICKVFDLAVGMTGTSEKVLQREGKPYEKVYVHPLSNAGYYPGAEQMTLKLLFDPENGKVLGAQAIGAEGIDKRIDVISVAIRASMTVDDLKELQLSYAPAYGSAKDAVNYAGYVASNVMCGDVRICHAADIAANRDDQILLDVRTTDEYAMGTIDGAVNVELDGLRGRLGELDREKEFIVFCQVGLRAYLACRVLEQNGFRCVNLSGGYKTYLAATANYNGERRM